MPTTKTKTTFAVLYAGRGSGPAGDGTHTKRFTVRENAESFAAGKTYYGQPATVQEEETSLKVFKRWQREGKIG